ncbi:MAG: hypothetical protein LBV72_09540 [Tannerella sp.]|nr:hypothetical protein [Tannerella sp.]
MKKIIIYISVIFLLSCGNNKQETPAAITLDDEKESVSKPEEPEADAVSSATAVENDVTFNGIIVIPPDRQATITLPINGLAAYPVAYTCCFPGTDYRPGLFSHLRGGTSRKECDVASATKNR